MIPTKSFGQTLRGYSQELHVYVKIGQRQDDPLQSLGTLHPVSFLKSIKNPTKNVLHTFNRGKNMLINVRLPIAHHVIGHPETVARSCVIVVRWFFEK